MECQLCEVTAPLCPETGEEGESGRSGREVFPETRTGYAGGDQVSEEEQQGGAF